MAIVSKTSLSGTVYRRFRSLESGRRKSLLLTSWNSVCVRHLSLFERDITINRHIKPKEIRERATIYHRLPRVPYISTWRATERLCDTLNGNEGASFKLIPTWIERVKAAQGQDFYAALQTSENGSFEAVFIVFGPINLGIQTLRPFYAFDGTHTRSRYDLTLLGAVGVDAEDHVLPLAFALVPIENEKWWSWFYERFMNAFNTGLSAIVSL